MKRFLLYVFAMFMILWSVTFAHDKEDPYHDVYQNVISTNGNEHYVIDTSLYTKKDIDRLVGGRRLFKCYLVSLDFSNYPIQDMSQSSVDWFARFIINRGGCKTFAISKSMGGKEFVMKIYQRIEEIKRDNS